MSIENHIAALNGFERFPSIKPTIRTSSQEVTRRFAEPFIGKADNLVVCAYDEQMNKVVVADEPMQLYEEVADFLWHREIHFCRMPEQLWAILEKLVFDGCAIDRRERNAHTRPRARVVTLSLYRTIAELERLVDDQSDIPVI